MARYRKSSWPAPLSGSLAQFHVMSKVTVIFCLGLSVLGLFGGPECNTTVAFGQLVPSDSATSVTSPVKSVMGSSCGLRFWIVTLTNFVRDGSAPLRLMFLGAFNLMRAKSCGSGS